MDNDKKKQAIRDWKLRKMDYGVISFRCKSTGDVFLGATSDTKRGFNRHLFQLDAQAHPNKQLQALWDEYGAEAFETAVVAELDYDDPTEDQTEMLQFLLEECLQKEEGAQML